VFSVAKNNSTIALCQHTPMYPIHRINPRAAANAAIWADA